MMHKLGALLTGIAMCGFADSMISFYFGDFKISALMMVATLVCGFFGVVMLETAREKRGSRRHHRPKC